MGRLMFFLIYKITDLTTGEIYVGKHKTENLNDGYMGSGTIITRRIKKHGKNNLKYLNGGWNLGRPFKWNTSLGESKF